MELKDYYAILGVERTDDLKAIKTAYRRLARKYHPDVSTEKDAETRFKEIAEAYEVLKDQQRREEYDQLWQHRNDPRFNAHQSGGQSQHSYGDEHSADFSDFFSSMFGQQGRQSRQQRPQRGQDIETEVAVFLEEAQTGETRTIRYTLPEYDVFGSVIRETPKTLKVKIPAGVGDGERIRLKGQGAPGSAGGPAGDLYLVVRIAPHPLFDVVGNDLEVVLPLAPWEAVLGTKVALPTLHDSILLTIPAGTQAGKRLRLKGKGLSGKKQQGDLYAVIKIVVPATTDEKSRELWQQLAEAGSGYDPRQGWGKK
ncbi:MULTISPECIES: curved DNA-binding protein [Tatumella]|uniref:Curved DNA-binding protein n=1 Tax=Tatumella punctata TaxID=399969 RepID=A0ABW1VSU1_9GAMM|nr:MULTISPECIES: curved DNA-binding protein [unclassified Tatumella]MBS0856029.1 curved DNA-binding protein [Tatumella sp. JGM16]MBS0878088.1 curved DNA-binding protein [Tatumella sp. JGM82]MBS0890447.1 curved DNA-binding protein [Tatumella sp. JGM94]MBS0894664.1 curved DNA-binding protein [Tatumella sp. JGM130]MBS0900903.1 curved DNA-binding protein [Tatumella sp. JGM100]